MNELKVVLISSFLADANFAKDVAVSKSLGMYETQWIMFSSIHHPHNPYFRCKLKSMLKENSAVVDHTCQLTT